MDWAVLRLRYFDTHERRNFSSTLYQEQGVGAAGLPCRLNNRCNLRGRGDRLLVDRDDHVPTLEPLVCGIAVGIDRGDDNSPNVRRYLQRLSDLRGERLQRK